ncbi:hypothetical protein ACFCXT_25485 [Streptomyces vinaceus]|uniref:COG1470 family protein n=1 Tax=Streptomyces vinaceus TaxID=1960 RepID=UPI0035E0EE9B
MGVIASLSDEVTEVEPGESARCTIKLCNSGAVVDTFLLDIRGDVKDWTKITTPEVSIFPGEVATVDIVFSPPREAAVKEGRVGYAVRVMSQEDTENSAIVEGAVEVAGFRELETELISRTLRGSRSARGRLAVDNLGNSPVTVRLTGADDDAKLRFHFPRSSVTVDGGTTRVIPYRLKPRSRFLRGEARTHVYRIQAKGPGVKSEAAGSLVQPAMLAPWAPRALLMAVGAAAVAMVMVPTYFAPQATSLLSGKNVPGDEDSSSDPVVPASSSTSTGDAKKEETTLAKGNAQQTPGGNGDKGSNPGQGTPTGTAPPGNTQQTPAPVLADMVATNFRLEAKSKPAKAGTYSVKRHEAVAKGQTLAISDLHIENVAKDTGTVQLRRNDEVLYEYSLGDEKKEWHWLEPIVFTEGQQVTLAVNCTNGDNKDCTPAFAFSGRTYTVAR